MLRNPLRLLMFSLLLIAFLPLFLLGTLGFMIRLKTKNRGISGTAYEPFVSRVLFHHAGTRDDTAAVQLAPHLPALSPSVAWLLIGSMALAARLSGYQGSFLSYPGPRPSSSLLLVMVRRTAFFDEALSTAGAPTGLHPAQQGVVLGAGWPGILLHEAVGHGLEGDFNRKGTSAFTGKVGQKVASELCTIVDDGTLPNRRGSLAVDDEGTPGQYNVLVENGVLCGYMQDKMNARLMGVEPTGNGRRESFAHIPMPRMTNTYMLAGPHDPDEIIQSVERGLYAPNFGGGQVDITSGKFVFSAN